MSRIQRCGLSERKQRTRWSHLAPCRCCDAAWLLKQQKDERFLKADTKRQIAEVMK